MIWSKYNFVFRSEKYGGLLYNAFSNSFLAVPEKYFGLLSDLREGDEVECDDLVFLVQLTAANALVEPGEDARLRDMLRMRLRSKFYSDRHLKLAIAPTMACNCACPYCFEKSHDPIHMNDETEAALVKFAERFQPGNTFDVSWYGGEPLLRFEQMRRLSEKFQALPFRKYKASITTNGTLLTADVVSHLDEMAVRTVQITIDGPQEIHDSRRKFVDGSGTYQLILDNLDRLMQSGWDGMLKFRVNVDKTNREHYAQTYHFLQDRYKEYGKEHVMIYSAFTALEAGCGMTPSEAADFVLESFGKDGAVTSFYYPKFARLGCIASCKNSFVVGPEGELYKCLWDIGIREKRVGTVFAGQPWNNILLAEYLEGTSPLNDPKCLDCKYFPICNGGCPRARMKDGGKCNFFFKGHLPQLLEARYDSLQKQQTTSEK